MNTGLVGILGATSFVGQLLVPMLLVQNREVVMFSRTPPAECTLSGARWARIGSAAGEAGQIGEWVCLMPIWILPDYFELLLRSGATRIVAVSSTSRFSKMHSSDGEERLLARRLADGEARLQAWAEQHGVEWTILRPTMVYGGGQDRNVSDIARFVARWRFFPVIDGGRGLRQPIHASDVAAFCQRALCNDKAINAAFNVCGGETLSYRDMVKRISVSMGIGVCLVHAPRILVVGGVWVLTRLPRFRKLSPALVNRMAQDLAFDGSAANALLGVEPRRFVLMAGDLPPSGGRWCAT